MQTTQSLTDEIWLKYLQSVQEDNCLTNSTSLFLLWYFTFFSHKNWHNLLVFYSGKKPHCKSVTYQLLFYYITKQVYAGCTGSMRPKLDPGGLRELSRSEGSEGKRSMKRIGGRWVVSLSKFAGSRISWTIMADFFTTHRKHAHTTNSHRVLNTVAGYLQVATLNLGPEKCPFAHSAITEKINVLYEEMRRYFSHSVHTEWRCNKVSIETDRPGCH